MVMEVKSFADRMEQTGALESIKQLVECHNRMLKSTHDQPETEASNELPEITSQALPSDLSSAFPLPSMTDTQQGRVQCTSSARSSSSSSSLLNNRRPLADVDENQATDPKAHGLPGINRDNTEKHEQNSHVQKVCSDHSENAQDKKILNTSSWAIPETLTTSTATNKQQEAQKADAPSDKALSTASQPGGMKKIALFDDAGWELPPGLLVEGTASTPKYAIPESTGPPVEILQSGPQDLRIRPPNAKKNLAEQSVENGNNDEVVALNNSNKDVGKEQSAGKVAQAIHESWTPPPSNKEEPGALPCRNAIHPHSAAQTNSSIEASRAIKSCTTEEEGLQANSGGSAAPQGQIPPPMTGFNSESGRMKPNIPRCESKPPGNDKVECPNKSQHRNSDGSQDGQAQGPGWNQNGANKSALQTSSAHSCDMLQKGPISADSKTSELEGGSIKNQPSPAKGHHGKSGWGPQPTKSNLFLARCGWTSSRAPSDHRNSERPQYQSSPVQESIHTSSGTTDSRQFMHRRPMQDADVVERARYSARCEYSETNQQAGSRGFQGSSGYREEDENSIPSDWGWGPCRGPVRGGRGGQMAGRGYSSRPQRGGHDGWAPL